MEPSDGAVVVAVVRAADARLPITTFRLLPTFLSPPTLASPCVGQVPGAAQRAGSRGSPRPPVSRRIKKNRTALPLDHRKGEDGADTAEAAAIAMAAAAVAVGKRCPEPALAGVWWVWHLLRDPVLRLLLHPSPIKESPCDSRVL
jgi:hypothetical protein